MDVLYNYSNDRVVILDVLQTKSGEYVLYKFAGLGDEEVLEREELYRGKDRQQLCMLGFSSLILHQAVGYEDIRSRPGTNIQIAAFDDIVQLTSEPPQQEAEHRKLKI
jgi:hypothetical protein